MTVEQAKAQIRDIIHKAPEGSFYPEQRQQLNEALASLRSHARSYEFEHIRELEGYLDMFESPQKARRIGYDQIRVRVLSELDKIGRHDDQQ